MVKLKKENNMNKPPNIIEKSKCCNSKIIDCDCTSMDCISKMCSECCKEIIPTPSVCEVANKFFASYFGIYEHIKLDVLKSFIRSVEQKAVLQERSRINKIVENEILIKCPCEKGDCEYCEKTYILLEKIDNKQ